MSLFSIIIPIYKVEAYLEKCVTSAMEQTFGDIEIILVDDGSPDACSRLCDGFARKDGRIRVIHQQNRGISCARNAGLAAATGAYILFLDGDDALEKTACEGLLPFTETGADILLGCAVVEGGRRDLEHLPFEGFLPGAEYYKRALRAEKNQVVVWLNGYRRQFLQEKNLRFAPGICHEDEDFTPRVFLLAQSVVYTGVQIYRYTLRPGSITQRTDKEKNLADYYTTCQRLEKLYETVEDKALQNLLQDALVCGYLSLFQEAGGHRYGSKCVHRGFCLRNAKRVKTRLKSLLFALSPRVYWQINHLSKGGQKA